MRSFLAVVLLFGFLTAAHAQQDADEKYMSIYGSIQAGDSLSGEGQTQQALGNYQQAQNDLNLLHSTYPDWNPRIVLFRQRYLAGRIAELKAQLPAPSAPPAAIAGAVNAPVITTTPSMNNAPTVAAPAAPADWAEQLSSLRDQLQNAQSDNATLAAKLKEALAVQPAITDPRELADARQQVRDLMKQNDLLKAGMEQHKQDLSTNVRYQQLKKLTKELKAANDRLADQQKQADELTAENEANLHKYLTSSKALAAQREEAALLRKQLTAATNTVTTLEASLAAANAETVTLHAEIKSRTDEVKNLRAQIKSAAKSDRPVAKLKTELASDQTQIDTLRADLQVKTEEADALQKQVKESDRPDRSVEKLKQELADARAEAKAAEADKAALQQRIHDLQAANAGTPAVADTDARIQDLTRERDELLAQLGDANRKLLSRKTSKEENAAQIAALNTQLAAARDQLSALTLTPVPYTPEELALFVTPVTEVHKAPVNQMPAGTAELAASAQKHFAAQQLDEAGADYEKILERDTNNVATLANLAAIEINEGHFDSAEAHLRTALAREPDDAYSLTQLGNIQLHEHKYSEALTSLSRAVALDNSNPETYNYLGVTLGHQGLRAQAETALRKAIQISPNFGPAHLNLAVIYLNQQPPSPQLARWHYQKALDAGEAHSAGIEKGLSDLGAPINP